MSATPATHRQEVNFDLQNANMRSAAQKAKKISFAIGVIAILALEGFGINHGIQTESWGEAGAICVPGAFLGLGLGFLSVELVYHCIRCCQRDHL